MQEEQVRVECAHGDGNTEGSRATRRDEDSAGLAGERRESSVLSALEPTAGGMPLRRVRGGAVPAVLCGEAGASQLGAGGVLPAAADRVFRRDRFGAWDRLAGAGLAGTAALSPGRTGGVAARSLALRRFLRVGLEESPPDHSTISRTRRLMDVETHRE